MANMKNISNQIPVVTLNQVLETITAVGLGKAELPAWAGKNVYIGEEAKEYWEGVEPQGESLDSFSKLYSSNLDLISALANDHPESIVALAKLIKREESNVSRTLNKLEKFGLVELVPSKTGRTKRPVLVMKMVRFDLDLLSGRMSLAGMRHSAAA